MQRLVYFVLKVVIIPALVASGLLYLYYHSLGQAVGFVRNIDLGSIALWHPAAAFLMVSFLVVHVYMTTTGRTPVSNIKAMLVGYEEIDTDQTEKNSTP